jgi:hypothetical protein
MLYRHKDGTYTWSTPDGEESKELTREEGLKYIKNYPGMPKNIRLKLLTEVGEGFIIT